MANGEAKRPGKSLAHRILATFDSSRNIDPEGPILSNGPLECYSWRYVIDRADHSCNEDLRRSYKALEWRAHQQTSNHMEQQQLALSLQKARMALMLQRDSE